MQVYLLKCELNFEHIVGTLNTLFCFKSTSNLNRIVSMKDYYITNYITCKF